MLSPTKHWVNHSSTFWRVAACGKAARKEGNYACNAPANDVAKVGAVLLAKASNS